MRLIHALVLVILVSGLVVGQINLLKSSRPEIAGGWKSDLQKLQPVPGAGAWTAFGSTEIRDIDSRPTFITRYGGHFNQAVSISPSDVGKYVLLIGMGSANRVFATNDITDHPYLYGYMETTGHIVAYLQGQQMLWESETKDEWKCLYGVFVIPPTTNQIRFFLNAAQRKGTDYDGSESRFEDPGLFIFDTSADAEQSAAKYCAGSK